MKKNPADEFAHFNDPDTDPEDITEEEIEIEEELAEMEDIEE